ncbi:hypothetical protein J7J84_03115 [bacterium]|nr:hypothetical protein [bacterium]
MKKITYIAVITLVALLLLAIGCGGRHSPQKQTVGAPIPTTGTTESVTDLPQTNAFTEEDYRLMAMPYEERLAYLEQRPKALVFEMHGIVVA